ncbi:hypothetical protein SUGI_0035870 [Cryptomeria japonica]|uniref:uncharacterized protein LOC131075743 n=1 Tax=Cryptomeria japonica TaxID=3369 RepID=UPI002408A7D3|nr:uncharacterized protein LOC131075743 [Cryptomeria japonica]GLJ06304.1 hypothetical protein SUGI_0035870 [Cryptomeria japonica]
MENVNPPNLLRHLEKESEVLTQAHQSVKNELTKLQVEEDMLMQTFYNILSAQGLLRRRENMNVLDMCQNQVPEEFPSRQREQNGLQNGVSRSLAIVCAEPENGVLEGREIESNNSRAPLLLLPAESQDNSWSQGNTN